VESGWRSLLVDLSVWSYASYVRTRAFSLREKIDATNLRRKGRRNLSWLVRVAKGEQAQKLDTKIALQCGGSSTRSKRDESAIVSYQCSYEKKHRQAG